VAPVDLRTVNDYEPLTPEWWVQRLWSVVLDRQDEIDIFDRYYRGDFPLPWLAPQAAEEFRRILSMTRSNFMGLVVDSMVERMNLEGFRVGDNESADMDLWRIWQRNNMDSDFDQGILEAAICGVSYLLVEPNPEDSSTPHIHIEHPSQAAVEFVPGTNRRQTQAGLKVWDDEHTGKVYATLQLLRGRRVLIYKFQAEKPKKVRGRYQRMEWVPRDGVRFVGRSPLPEVSLYELPNNPRLLTGGRSELSDVLDIQDRICKTIADRLVDQDYGAFPQKWASAWPESDADGNPTPAIEIGRNRMITTEVAETKFGQFEASDLKGYVLAKAEDVKDIASRTRTPAQYLLGELSNVNGETLKASESGLVSKVRQRTRALNDPVERAAKALRRLASLPEPDADIEIVWRNPEFRTEGELVDALFKLGSPPINIPRKAIWEKWGATPPEIKRWEQMMLEQRRQDDVLAMMTARYQAMATAGVENAQSQQQSGSGGGRARRGRSGGSQTKGDGDGDGIKDESLLE
jgi:hypothetical protein